MSSPYSVFWHPYDAKYIASAVTVCSPRFGSNGWPFASVEPFPGAEVDPLYDSKYVRDLYLRADPSYAGR